MRIERVIEATLDIDDPIGFSADPNYLLGLLRNIFEGRCYSRCLILDVLRVERQSFCTMDNMRVRYVGHVSVAFTAKVLLCNVGDVLHGCAVVKVDPQFVLCKYKEFSIKAVKRGVLATVAKGHLVSVVVTAAVYQLGEATIFVSAEPFVCSPVSTWMRVGPSLSSAGPTSGTQDDTPAVAAARATMLKAIKKADAIRAASGKAWTTFEGLYYPFTAPKPLVGRQVSLVGSTLASLTPSAFVSRPAALQSSAVFLEVDECPPSDVQLSAALTDEQIMVSLMLDCAAYLRNIRRICEVYNTSPLISQHAAMFAAVKQAKVAPVAAPVADPTLKRADP